MHRHAVHPVGDPVRRAARGRSAGRRGGGGRRRPGVGGPGRGPRGRHRAPRRQAGQHPDRRRRRRDDQRLRDLPRPGRRDPDQHRRGARDPGLPGPGGRPRRRGHHRLRRLLPGFHPLRRPGGSAAVRRRHQLDRPAAQGRGRRVPATAAGRTDGSAAAGDALPRSGRPAPDGRRGQHAEGPDGRVIVAAAPPGARNGGHSGHVAAPAATAAAAAAASRPEAAAGDADPLAPTTPGAGPAVARPGPWRRSRPWSSRGSWPACCGSSSATPEGSPLGTARDPTRRAGRRRRPARQPRRPTPRPTRPRRREPPARHAGAVRLGSRDQRSAVGHPRADHELRARPTRRGPGSRTRPRPRT